MPHAAPRRSRLTHPSALAAALLCAAALPALAASSVASSAAEGSSASIGSVSDSFKSSSNSSTTKTAQGDYRITDVAAADGQPGMVRLTLAPTDGGTAEREPLQLTLPQAAVDRGRLARGELVTAQPRAYGVAFARQDEPQQAFFLVLEDTWYRELPAHPVVL